MWRNPIGCGQQWVTAVFSNKVCGVCVWQTRRCGGNFIKVTSETNFSRIAWPSLSLSLTIKVQFVCSRKHTKKVQFGPLLLLITTFVWLHMFENCHNVYHSSRRLITSFSKTHIYYCHVFLLDDDSIKSAAYNNLLWCELV